MNLGLKQMDYPRSLLDIQANALRLSCGLSLVSHAVVCLLRFGAEISAMRQEYHDEGLDLEEF